MARGRSIAATVGILAAAACAWPSPERQLLLDFFQACRIYDTTVLARLATATCNPQADGVVQDFDIVSVENVTDGSGAARVVTLDARMRPLGGSPAPRRLTVRLQQLDGRWMVAAITLPPASRTSPAASSALPN